MTQPPPALLRGTLADQIESILIDRILAGQYNAGDFLRTRTLAEEFGVSTTPVREALTMLESAGLVGRRAHIGFEVSNPPTPFEMDQIMAARRIFEPAATELACSHGAPVVRRVREAYEEQERTGRTETMEDYLAFMHADDAFHRAIWEGTGNRYIADMLGMLGGVIHRWRRFTPGLIIDRDIAVTEHERILLALESGDPAAASQAMLDHIDNQRERIRQQVGQDRADRA
ncbi:GntR family transcriptional regulator [Actinomyces sp. B33]|uniref:GntR family transcriptional regulator n=1 Tax=Actinomyces sp. B33 TaxID=2942131 RepID=UPI0023411DE8|nr:GntR family transcriptional regulator [Actinomyces sp. B33]MDC4232478.1 GntR family transcriptional regulator [Actinomyces sp. B33]